MKNRGKPIFHALAAVLALALACCTAEDRRGELPGKEVSWRISINSGETSRSEDAAFPGGVNTIADATLYFYRESDGRMLRLRPLSDVEVASVNAGEQLTIRVPASADRFLMTANNGEVNIDSFATIDEALGTVFGIASQMSAGEVHSAENVILVGMNATYDLREPGLYEASIRIAPLVARLEIGPLCSAPVEAGIDTPGDVKGFTVSGIYLNRFHMESDLNPVHTVFVDNEGVAEKYSPLNLHYGTSGLYDIPGVVSDPATGIAVPLTGDVWAYQFFPSGMPHIIVELNDILYSDGEGGTMDTSLRTGAGGTQYLTVKGYTLTDGSEVTSADRARIYKLSRLEFNADHLSDNPYEVQQTIRATLSVLPWDEEVINTEYD